MKPSSIEVPKSYLVADMGHIYYENVSYAWTMVSKTYLEKYINNLRKKLEADGFIFNKNLSNMKYSPKQPFLTTSYFPELDTSV